MMREQHYEETNGNKTFLLAIIKSKFASARNCIVLPCQLCLLARARKHTPNVLQMHLLDDHEGGITRDQYNVGDFVSTDQFICKTPGRLPIEYGRESQDPRFKAVPSLMMQHLDLFGLKTKFLLVPTIRSWERRISSSGFMTNVSVKLSTIMVIMVSSPRRSFGVTVRINSKVSCSLVLAPNTRM
jgi:hypothetical protein